MNRFFFSICLLLFAHALKAQGFSYFMEEGIKAYNQLEFNDASYSFKAAIILENITPAQKEEAESWLEKARKGAKDKILEARALNEKIQREADILRSRTRYLEIIAEAGKWAHSANKELENDNIDLSFALAYAALKKVANAPSPQVLRAFGDAVQAKFGKRVQAHSDGIKSFGNLDRHNSFYTQSRFGELTLWNKEGKVQTRKKLEHLDLINEVGISSNQNMLLSTSRDGVAKLFELPSLKDSKSYAMQAIIEVGQFSPSLDQIVLGARNGAIKMINFKQNGQEKLIQAHQAPIVDILSGNAFDFFLTATYNEVKIWNWEGSNFGTLTHGDKPIANTYISNTSMPIILTVGGDSLGKLWDSMGNLIASLDGHRNPVIRGAFSQDGQKVLTCDTEGLIKVWQVDGTLLGDLDLHEGMVKNAAFSLDDAQVISIADNTIIWDVNQLQVDLMLNQETSPMKMAALSSTADLALTASEKSARLWNTNGDILTSVTGFSKPISFVSFLFDEHYFFVGAEDGYFLLCPLPSYIYQQIEEGKLPVPTVNKKTRKKHNLN